MKKIFISAFAVFFTMSLAYSQCTQWLLPTPTTSWTDFAGQGGAPCSATPPASLQLGFGAWAAESYSIPNVKQNGQYTFGICANFVPAAEGGWTPTFTVFDPEGNVVAFGRDTGSQCALSFTAPVTGTYVIAINRAGSANCGLLFQDANGANIENGNPEITYTGGASCDPPVTTCEAGTLDASNTAAQICPEESTVVNTTGMIVPNSPTLGGAGINFNPLPGATGGVINAEGNSVNFNLIGLSAADFPYDIDRTLDGILPANSLPSLGGNWELRPYVYANQATPSVACDSTATAATINFLAAGEGACVEEECAGGDVTAVDQGICPGDVWELTLAGELLPDNGVVVWIFLEANDTTGASDRFINFGNDPTFYNFTGDLNDLLVQSAIAPIAPGSYLTFAGIFDLSASAYCDFTEGFFTIDVFSEDDAECGPVVPPCTLPYPQVTGQAEAFQANGVALQWNAIPGSLGCEIQGGLASGGPTQTFQVIQPNLSQFFVPQSQLTPGQTYRWRVRCGCSLTVAGAWTAYQNFLWNPGGGIIAFEDGSAMLMERTTEAFTDVSNAESAPVNFRKMIVWEGNTRYSVTAAAPVDLRKIRDTNVETFTSTPGTILSEDLYEVFPNPSTGTINIRYSAQTEGLATIRVFDAVGKIVKSQSIAMNGGINFFSLELSGLDRGLYTIEVVEGSKRSVERVVIAR